MLGTVFSVRLARIATTPTIETLDVVIYACTDVHMVVSPADLGPGGDCAGED